MSKKVFFCITLIIVLLYTSTTFSQENTYRYPKLKDPILGATLSWYTPGMGQFYAEKPVKGTIFFLSEWTLIISGIITLVDINFSFGGKKGVSISFTEKEEEWGYSINRKSLATSLFISAIVLHIYNVIDAIESVKDYNRKILLNFSVVPTQKKYYTFSISKSINIR